MRLLLRLLAIALLSQIAAVGAASVSLAVTDPRNPCRVEVFINSNDASFVRPDSLIFSFGDAGLDRLWGKFYDYAVKYGAKIGQEQVDDYLGILADCHKYGPILAGAASGGSRNGLSSTGLEATLGQGTYRMSSDWVIGDFTGDGKPDSLAVNANTYSFQAAQPDGSFAAIATKFTLGPTTSGWSTGDSTDVNGDGRADLVLCCSNANTAPRIAVALGKGNGTFEAPTDSIPGGGVFTLTDWNGDGRADILTPTSANQVTIAIAQANGTFSVTQTIPLAASGILAADVTGDGLRDVLALSSTSLTVLPGQAGGSVGSGIVTNLPFDRASLMTAGDMNGDGRLDVAVLDPFRGVLTVLVNNQAGQFRVARTISTMRVGNVAIGDLDKDGSVELLIPGGPSQDITFLTLLPEDIVVGRPLYMIPRSGTAFPSAAAATVADFTGDGKADIAILGRNGDGGAVTVYPGVPSILRLTPLAPSLIQSPTNAGQTNFVDAVAVDFNGDNRIDLATIDTSSRRLIPLTGNGQGSFIQGAALNPGFEPYELAVADFNADGRPDVAVAGANIVVYTGTAGGTFQGPIAAATGVSARHLAIGDFNGDSRPDIAFTSTNGAAMVLNQSGASFGAPVTLTVPTSFSLGSIAAADLNNDARPDLLIGGIFLNQGSVAIGPLHVMLSNGNGTFNTLVHQRGIAEGIGSIVTTDLDKDGKLDLITTADSTRYYLGNGDGTFLAARHIPTGQDTGKLFLADANGDGVAELFGANPAGVTIDSLPKNLHRAASASAASGFLPPVAPDSIVSAYGSKLASSIAPATAINQTELAGTKVWIEDAAGAGFLAPLFFVSPGQVNYLVPSEVALGTAQVTISSSTGDVSQADLVIDRVGPGLFIFPNSGDLVAANIIRVRGAAQSAEDVFTLAGAQIQPRPIDLGPSTDTLVLVLYGTGIRGRTSLSATKVRIGGIDLAVDFAGAQTAYPGLDQVNVTLPRTLAGRGKVDIVLTVDGKQSNIGNLTIR